MPKLCGCRDANTVLAGFLRYVLSLVGRMNDLVQRLAVTGPRGHACGYCQTHRLVSFQRELFYLDTSTEPLGKPGSLVNATVWQHDEELLTAMPVCCTSVERQRSHEPLKPREYRPVHDGLCECRVQPLEIVDVEKDYANCVPGDSGSLG